MLLLRLQLKALLAVEYVLDTFGVYLHSVQRGIIALQWRIVALQAQQELELMEDVDLADRVRRADDK